MIREIMQVESLRNGKKKLVFDSGESCLLYPKEVARLQLAEHAQVDDACWEQICQSYLLPRAKRRVLHLLEQMDRTERQLLDKLKRDGYPDRVSREAIQYAASYHYIDDLRYANAYVRSHQDKKSRRQMVEALLQKGIAKDVIEAALEESFTADPRLLIDRLLEQKNYDPDHMDRREKSRIYQSLMRKGFSSADVLEAMQIRQ